jgi:hypothetical protein
MFIEIERGKSSKRDGAGTKFVSKFDVANIAMDCVLNKEAVLNSFLPTGYPPFECRRVRQDRP